jgi:hypothetical protein
MNTKIFLLHHLPAIDRKESLIKDLKDVSLTYPLEWVEEFLPADIATKYKHTITIKELSLSLKHQYSINQQIEHNIQNIIIFEDDINLKSVPQINLYLERCLNDINNFNADILWIGGTYGLQVPENIKNNQHVSYFSSNFLSRCTHGYILNIKASSKIIEKYNYDLPVDHLYNKIISECGLTSGWTAPFLTQKTVEGEWRSTIRDNSR